MQSIDFVNARRDGSQQLAKAILACVSCIAVAGQSDVLCAQSTGPSFVDDFTDGDSRDGSPARWEQLFWNAQDDQVTDSALNITASRGVSILSPRNETDDGWWYYDDVSLEAVGRITSHVGGTSAIELLARSSSAGAYVGAVTNAGRIYIFESFAEGGGQFLQQIQSNLDPTANDVHMRFELIGKQLEFYAWADGQAEPASPQLSVMDDSLSTGTIGMLLDSSPGPADFAFRSIAVNRVPEPTSLALVVITGVVLLFGKLKARNCWFVRCSHSARFAGGSHES